MEDLIFTIGKVQDAFSQIGSHEIELPQIVVIGSQSAGKSSVIEGIVKKDFLPRGPGMVTRGPILIQLIKPLDGDKKMKNGDFAVFGHLPDQTFTDFEKVRQEIVNETNRLAPQADDIYTKPINLKIYSSKVVNLSFIDLPGLITIKTEKQSDDIVKKIKDLNLTYISNTKSIILVVAQANNDMQNSVGLELAKSVDKGGARTLCILTMIDIMSPGTDATEMLNGKIIEVQRGIVGVVNRNEEDISNGMTIEVCQKEKEKKFFEDNYPSLASEQGAEFLSDSLNKILISHIRINVQDLRKRLDTLKYENIKLLESCGPEIADKKEILSEVINNFTSAYISRIKGNANNFDFTKDIKMLSGGAKISEIFHQEFKDEMDLIEPLQDLTEEIIEKALKSSQGPMPPIFFNDRGFVNLVTQQIKQFEQPMIKCVDSVNNELKSIIDNCGMKIQKEAERFPQLYKHIKKEVTDILSKHVEETKKFVKNLLEIELAYVNTKHPDFHPSEIIRKYDITESVSSADSNKIDQKIEYEDITKLIERYFVIIRTSIQDKVPKAIMKFLVNEIQENLQKDLSSKLNSNEDIDGLISESEAIKNDRKKAKAMLLAIKEADDALTHVL